MAQADSISHQLASMLAVGNLEIGRELYPGRFVPTAGRLAV